MPCTTRSMQHAACNLQRATCLARPAARWSQKPTRSSEWPQHRTVSRGNATRVHCTPARPHTRGVCCMAWRCSLLLGHADVHRSLHGRAAAQRCAERRIPALPSTVLPSTVLRRPHPVRDRPGPVLSDDARCTHAPSHRAAKSTCPPGVLTHFRRRRALWFRTTRNVGAGHAREVSPHSGRRSQLVLQRCVLPCCSVACGTGGPTAQVAEARINTLQVLPRATGAPAPVRAVPLQVPTAGTPRLSHPVVVHAPRWRLSACGPPARCCATDGFGDGSHCAVLSVLAVRSALSTHAVHARRRSVRLLMRVPFSAGLSALRHAALLCSAFTGRVCASHSACTCVSGARGMMSCAASACVVRVLARPNEAVLWQGLDTKMSASSSTSAIYVTDTRAAPPYPPPT